MDHSILTHNGMVTILNPKTGNHRTIRIRTQPADAGFAPGERVAALLTGPDNEADYLGFAFVDSAGVRVWRRKRGTVFDRYADMIQRPEVYEALGVQYKFDARCRRCNRTLTDPVSIDLGIGPVCRGER